VPANGVLSGKVLTARPSSAGVALTPSMRNLSPAAATTELVEMIERAGPFGAGNALPRFAFTGDFTGLERFAHAGTVIGHHDGPGQGEPVVTPYDDCVLVMPAVRQALLALQRDFARLPGLVADGRDMASVVFPDSATKVFLVASLEMRAMRRHKQLIEKGMAVSIANLLLDLRERDERDSQRGAAPMQQSPDAELLDTTNLTIGSAVAQVLDWVNKVPKKG